MMQETQANKIFIEKCTSMTVTAQARAVFLNTCYKVCPKCGNILHISDRGCGNCFTQFGGKIDKDRR